MNHIGVRIRELREEQGISQQVLADSIGVKQTTISEIERGNNKPSWKNLQKLAQFFGVPLSQLIDEPVSPLRQPV